MLINWIICGLLFLASGFDGVRTYDDSVSNRIDHSVLLKCPIDIATCGALHSVKWFKGNVRIAVVSGDGGVANVKEEFKGRMSIEHSQEGPYTYLSITSLQISDEDIYTCESTFLEPVEACNTAGAFRIELKVEVPPASIQLFDENGAHLKNGTTLGPLREGNTLKTVCDVKETRPIPTIGWYRGDRRLTDSVTVDETNGLFSVKSELSMILSRQELGTKIECRITTPAIEKMVTNYVLLDLQVRPTTINMFGVKHHVVQDSIVSLVCEVTGARPPANISWYNSTILMDPLDRTRTEFQTSTFLHNDGTFTTNSTLKFTASRFEHGETIRCEADNIVMKDEREKPLHKTQVFNVLYPPVVIVKPENVTVNETQEFLLFCDYEANPATLEVVRWLKNGEPLNINQSRFEGGNSEHTALSVKDSSRDDDGVYTCELTNSVGKSVSDNEINVDVQFVPTVELTMEPDVPVIENNQANVTLYCNVIHGNPSTLLRVRWFLEGGLLKELPDCNINSDSEDLCNIDPSKLLLEDIGRDFLGNYSCEGMNSAGWGERSAENDLIVYYKPGNATLAHHPQIAIKKKSVTFSCSVEDTGLPTATKYKWLRGGSPVMDLVTPIWTVDPVGLDTRTNFSCSAFNDAGLGNPATIELDVHAPPAFIHKMSPYTGVLFSAKNASLQCRIECIPKCSISWFKDGLGIPETDERFFIKEKYLPAEPATGDFESIYSVLHFNMSAWPQEKFDMHTDNANFSCVSSNNSVGPGVRSATYFSVEYPPENTTVTNRVVDVIEDNIPERVLCTAKANPEPTFEWYHGEDLVSRSSALIINQVMKRDKAGTYKCKSQNKHGAHFENIEIRVLYPPACEISRRDIDDKDTLICTADGNPAQAGFSWLQKLENQSIELEGGRIDGYSSYLELKEDTVTRTYRCVANNTVGPGMFCEIEVAVRPKRHVAWWKSWNRTTQIILMAAILAILAVIILCCIIICICRRRRRQNKLHGKSSALGDPLTEPGEYENLPFHGLQTAPNKFATTPINFNSTNVVRVTPRPKLINNNQLQQQQQQQQQLHQIQQQQSLKPPFSTMTSSSQTLLLSSSSATNPANDGAGGVVSGNNIRTNNDSTTNCIGPSNTISSGSKTIPSNSNQINYNLSNCFPTSYTAYYNQQQQQKTLVNNSQIGNSFINNFPYTVENSTGQYNGIIDNGIPCSGAGQRISGFNPFIVNNLKKFNTNSGCRQAGHRKKPQIENNEKKFYSLKSLGNRKGLHFCSMKPSTLGLLTSNSKCKRHHSFAGGGAGDVVSDIGGTNTLPFITQTHTKMKFYEPPLYENLTDSIQIHESSLGNFQHPSQQQQQQQQQNLQNSQNQKQHHSKHSHHHHHHHQQQQHQLQHQKIDDFNNLMEPERLSIYRSDSGISNSSYECITPIPAPRQLLTQQKSHHSLTRCQKSPVYMNLSGTTPSSSSSIIGQSLSIATSTPNQSNIVNPPPPPPSLPSSSSSTNPSSSSCGDGGGGIPLASSSSSSLSIHVNHHHQNSPSCNNVNNINNNSNSNNNNNDKCHQHQQQQHKQQHFQHHSHHSGKSINRKCKKRGTPATATQSSASASLLSLEWN